jgi:hypothetical protein
MSLSEADYLNLFGSGYAGLGFQLFNFQIDGVPQAC